MTARVVLREVDVKEMRNMRWREGIQRYKVDAQARNADITLAREEREGRMSSCLGAAVSDNVRVARVFP